VGLLQVSGTHLQTCRQELLNRTMIWNQAHLRTDVHRA
jgi:hypothetical protein